MRLQACRVRFGVLLVLIAVGALGFSASASAETVTLLPEHGSEQEFSVPAGVTQVTVTAVGGAGHPAGSCRTNPGAGGGSGAKVAATIPVGALKTLYVDFGAGGSGGKWGVSEPCETGGDGGGSSDVRSEQSALSSRLIVAGGGGGGGFGYQSPEDIGGAGGNAAGLVGGNGLPGELCEFEGNTCSAQGAGGEGGGAHSGGEGGAGVNNCGSGSSGGLGAGGAGEPATGCNGNGGGGGGGGGGYYGGGGGGGSNNPGSGGGGAGSSYINETAGVKGTLESGAGDEQEVEITYTFPPPTAKIEKPESGGTYNPGQEVESAFSCSEGEGVLGSQNVETRAGAASCLHPGFCHSFGPFSSLFVAGEPGEHEYTVTARSNDG